MKVRIALKGGLGHFADLRDGGGGGCSWQVFSFYSHCACFINKICWNNDLQFSMFWCHSGKLKMFAITIDF